MRERRNSPPSLPSKPRFNESEVWVAGVLAGLGLMLTAEAAYSAIIIQLRSSVPDISLMLGSLSVVTGLSVALFGGGWARDISGANRQMFEDSLKNGTAVGQRFYWDGLTISYSGLAIIVGVWRILRAFGIATS